MDFPILDSRDYKQIEDALYKLAKSYVPQWGGATTEDSGSIFTAAFARMFYNTLMLYNQIPYKNLIYFLNLIGAYMLPCISSNGCITVKINEGTPEGVMVAKGVSVYGQDNEGERVLFEVMDDMLAIDSHIEEIFCQSILKDKIVRLSSLEEKGACCFFDFESEENLQKHCLYLEQDTVFFTGGKAQLFLNIKNENRPFLESKAAQCLSDSDYAHWEYYTQEGWKSISDIVCCKNLLSLILHEKTYPVECFGKNGFWLRCTLLDPLKYEDVCFTGFEVASAAENILPECLYSNDLCLVGEDFLPFARNFSLYDDFYINCNEAFSKSGAEIQVDFYFEEPLLAEEPSVARTIRWKTIMKAEELQEPEQQKLFVEKVVWEYWNGNGWARLFQSNDHDSFFDEPCQCMKSLRFHCPADIDVAFVGAEAGYWIRARIIEINNLYMENTVYVCPIIKKIDVRYTYQGQFMAVTSAFLENSLKVSLVDLNQGQEFGFSNRFENTFPTMYFRLTRAFQGGPIKLYYQKEGVSFQEMPSLKWEYWGSRNGEDKWLDLKIQDETNCFKQSGIITFICRDLFRECDFFGTKGYWIRIVNIDRKYDDKWQSDALPAAKGLYLNTVKIRQQERMNTEYFFIDSFEKNKKCQLNASNLLDVEVWVDEAARFAGDTPYTAADKEQNTEIETDDQGLIIKYWVKWDCINQIRKTSSESRVYILDKQMGCITFGDGIHGKIPDALETESIKVNYTISVGEKGNFEPFQIGGFSDAIPFVESVKNYERIMGACNQETRNDSVKRSMSRGKHQDRIVSLEDFVYMAQEADRNVFSATVFSGMDEDGKECSGSVLVAILPVVPNASEEYFAGMKNNILRSYSEKAPITLLSDGHIHVREVSYIEYSVKIQLKIKSYNDYHNTYKKVESLLEKYLDPIHGNFHGKGFQIGVLPTKMKLYNYLINHMESAEITAVHLSCFQRIRDYRREIDYDRIFELPFTVPLNGTHEIEIEMM